MRRLITTVAFLMLGSVAMAQNGKHGIFETLAKSVRDHPARRRSVTASRAPIRCPRRKT